MKKVILAAVLAALAFGAVGAHAGQGGNCSPEGTWYGYNTLGNLWIVTISRSGPQSFTTVMDNGVNLLFPGTTQSTDWRGEFVKTGPRQFDWTTMAYWRAEEGDGAPFSPFAFVLGLCPLTAEFTGCDSFQGEGVCDVYGFFTIEQDPFEEGIPLGEGTPLQGSFKRMPMTYPIP